MPLADEHPGDPAWYERAPSRTGSAPQAPGDDELDSIIRRAEDLGIPGWRVTAALGLPLLRSTAGSG